MLINSPFTSSSSFNWEWICLSASIVSSSTVIVAVNCPNSCHSVYNKIIQVKISRISLHHLHIVLWHIIMCLEPLYTFWNLYLLVDTDYQLLTCNNPIAKFRYQFSEPDMFVASCVSVGPLDEKQSNQIRDHCGQFRPLRHLKTHLPLDLKFILRPDEPEPSPGTILGRRNSTEFRLSHLPQPHIKIFSLSDSFCFFLCHYKDTGVCSKESSIKQR